MNIMEVKSKLLEKIKSAYLIIHREESKQVI